MLMSKHDSVVELTAESLAFAVFVSDWSLFVCVGHYLLII